MTHSVVKEYLHIMWSTKNQMAIFEHPLDKKIIEYICSIIKNKNSRLLDGVVLPDHVHLLISLNSSLKLSDLIRDLKTSTNYLLKEKLQRSFQWEASYAAFSVTPENQDVVQSFFSNQHLYHSSQNSPHSYKDELFKILMLHQIDFKEQYLLTTTHSRRLVHVVWTTKERDKWLEDSVRQFLFTHIRLLTSTMGINTIEAGGFYDHVHFLLELQPKHSLSEVIQSLKSLTMRELAGRNSGKSRKSWQEGFGAFSVSWSKNDVVKSYIQNQMEHHSANSCQFEPQFELEIKN